MISTPYSIDGARFVVVRWMTFGVEIFGAGLVTRSVCVAIMPLTREVKGGRRSNVWSIS